MSLLCGINRSIFAWLHGLYLGRAWVGEVALFVANYLAYFIVFLALVFLWRIRRRNRRWIIAKEALFAYLVSRWVLVEVVHSLFSGPRPFVALGFAPPFVPLTISAFPSAHVASLFAISYTVWRSNRRWGAILFTLSLLVGLGRVMAGVHWPGDILGGAVIGILGGMAAHALIHPPKRHGFTSGSA